MSQLQIDCLFIGHNEMNFEEFEKTVRRMGARSGAYRDLNLNFINYRQRPYNLPEFYNVLTPVNGSPLRMGETFSAAVAYLASYAARQGFGCDYVNDFREEREELADKLAAHSVMTVAITTTLYVTALPIIEIVQFVKQYNTRARIIVGGPFISTQCRSLESGELHYLFESMGADIYVNSSQGESALVHILGALRSGGSLAGIDNIYYRNAAGFTAAPHSLEDNRLAENPVDWDLFGPRLSPYVNVRTAISCPFACAFCGFPEHAGPYQTTGAAEVERELDQLQKIGRVKSIHFIDDTFNVPVNRFKEILRMMVKNRYRFRWHSHFRCQFADREMVELMKESHCEGVFLGLESGSQEMLQNMQKSASIDKYYKGIELLKDYGITTFASFIIGFPGETDETLEETRQLIESGGFDFYRAQLWYCETVTPIWRERERYRIEGRNFEWRHATLDSGTAADRVEEIFLTVDSATWVPQYNFDFDNLFHLTGRGMTIPQIKAFLNAFNRAVRDKLKQGPGSEVGGPEISRMLEACRPGGAGEELGPPEEGRARDKQWQEMAAGVEFEF
jgi:anaerobic magnesium-protoporphyrin IX monomethyl ester cyclase